MLFFVSNGIRLKFKHVLSSPMGEFRLNGFAHRVLAVNSFFGYFSIMGMTQTSRNKASICTTDSNVKPAIFSLFVRLSKAPFLCASIDPPTLTTQ